MNTAKKTDLKAITPFEGRSKLMKLITMIVVFVVFVAMPSVSIAQEDSTEKTFAKYARYGADVWARNPVANIAGQGQSCISCHTSLPYALVEPLLEGDYPAYGDIIENINNRIETWSSNEPWYADKQLEQMADLSNAPPDAIKAFLDADQSRGVEAVFNAVIRATHDAYSNLPPQTETRAAFRNMWEEQVKSGMTAGRWQWINVNLVPWEVTDSDIWGASFALVAASIFPDLAPEENMLALRASLKGAFIDDAVSLHSKSAILWGDVESGGQILGVDTANRFAEKLLALQRTDGGWSLRDLGPWPEWEGSASDCCSNREIRSDAYATGFVTFILARAGRISPDGYQIQLDRAIEWIDRELANPYPTGPRFNRHNTGRVQIPEFRDSLYTNAGHMWAYLAKTAYSRNAAPWATDGSK